MKTRPLGENYELEKMKKVNRCKIRWIRRLLHYGNFSLCQKLPESHDVLSRCIVAVKKPQFILPKFWSFLLQRVTHTSWNILKFADWLSYPAARTEVDDLHNEERNQHEFVFLSSASETSESFTVFLYAWIPGHTQKSMFHHQWWLTEAGQVQFEDSRRYPHTPAYSAPSDHHSAILAPFFAQSFLMPESPVVIFKTLSFSFSGNLRSFELSMNNHHLAPARFLL